MRILFAGGVCSVLFCSAAHAIELAASAKLVGAVVALGVQRSARKSNGGQRQCTITFACVRRARGCCALRPRSYLLAAAAACR